MNIPNTDNISKCAEKIKILERDLEKRKYRAMTFCNPSLAKEFSPHCVIIWKSIEKNEEYLNKIKKEIKQLGMNIIKKNNEL